MNIFSKTNVAFLQEKVFSFPLSFFILLFLPPAGVGDAYLILGHSHFMMTALYQYKMGRITIRSFGIYLLIFAFLFYIAQQIPNAFTLFVSLSLLFHVYTGEVRHIKKQFNSPYILMTLAFAVLLGSWLSMELWEFVFDSISILLLSGTLVLTACFEFLRKNNLTVELLFYTLLILYGTFVILELNELRPTGFESFGFIVIAHYFATYFNVYKSFTQKGGNKQWVFILESMAINILFLLGYLYLYSSLGTTSLLYEYVYNPISFYVWTLMHFITTMDFSSYTRWLSHKKTPHPERS